MVCPECGERLYRSHSRNFKESITKKLTSYKTYRCHNCEWRGMIAPAKANDYGERKRLIVFWLAGLIVALLIGVYAVSDLYSTQQPGPANNGLKNSSRPIGH